MSKKNFFLYFFIFQIIILLYLFNFYHDLTIWGVINKVLLFESSTTSLELLKQKIIPLFSFNINLGFPIFADSQHGLFEPINFFFLILFGPLEQINYSFFVHLILFVSSLFFLLYKIYNIDFNIALVASILNFFSPIHIDKNYNLKDDLIEYDEQIISRFILDYKFENIQNLFDKAGPYFLYFLNTYPGTKIKNLVPKIKIKDLNLIDLENFKFIPLWQSQDFYIFKNKKLEHLENFSFGYKIENNLKDQYIYYIPISFYLGFLISFIFLVFYVFINVFYTLKKYI